MELLFGDLLLQGDFELINIKELGFDRDFLIRPEKRVINLKMGVTLQLVDVRRILIRAGLTTGEAQIHFLGDTDVGSAVANFTLPADKFRLELVTRDFSQDFLILPKEAGAVQERK